MTEFNYTIGVSADDLDELEHVNNVVYVRYIQEVAAAHWQAAASPVLREQYAWMVLRHEIDYKAQAFLNDELIGTTWVGEHHGARFERYVKLVRKSDNKVIVESKTIWCMLDSKTLRPARIGNDVLAVL